MKNRVFWFLPFLVVIEVALLIILPVRDDSEGFFWLFLPLCAIFFVYAHLLKLQALAKIAVTIGFGSCLLSASLAYYDFVTTDITAFTPYRNALVVAAMVSFGLVISIFISAVMTLKGEGSRNQEADWLNGITIGSRSMSRAVVELDFESDKMRRVAFVSLIGVGGLIVLAVLVFLFAGVITSIDLSGADPNSAVSRELEILESADRDISIAKEDLLKRKEELAVSRIALNSETNPDDASKILGEIAIVENRLLEVTREHESNLVRISELESMVLKNLQESFTNSLDRPQDVSALIASAVTRFGVIIIMMYFAHSLIGLYRYTLRMSASYKAKGIALALAGGDKETIDFFAKFASTDHIGLGKEATSVMEEISKLGELVKSLRPSTS